MREHLTNLWPQVAPLVAAADRPSRYIDHEFGAVRKPDADFRFCMVYPDTYELGQPNQALRILVNAVNARPHLAAERGFIPAPDMCDALRREGLPIFSMESCAPFGEFDVIGFTLAHELVATNVLEALDLAGIPLRAADRAEGDPIIVAGGPCAYNPEPFHLFIDAFSIGEGEEAVPDALELIRQLRLQGASRADILRALAAQDGWYVPSLYRLRDEAAAQQAGSWLEPAQPGVPDMVVKRIYEGFATSPGWEPCVVPYAEVVHDRLSVEVLRGCARGCRFCQAGMMYRPVRERSVRNIVESVKAGLAHTGYDEVSLTSLSSTDHSRIAQVLEQLNCAFAGTGTRISLPSQRLDSFGVDMAGLVAGQKKGGLTFAPEAGTQRLRNVINKNVTEDDLFAAIDAAFAAGWRRCKLYFMIGLPTETDEDVKGIASLAQRAYDRAKKAVPPEQRGNIRMSVSAALFVPKAQTPFQWDGQIPPEEARRRAHLLRDSVKYKAVDVHWHDPATSFVEAVMSRGGRLAAEWVEAAWKRGARFDAWTEHFSEQAWRDAADEVGLDVEAVAQTSYEPGYVMPWAHISTGASARWLAKERRRAAEETTTPDCTFGACSACGACPGLESGNVLAALRVAAGSNAVGDDVSAGPPEACDGAASNARPSRCNPYISLLAIEDDCAQENAVPEPHGFGEGGGPQ